MQKSKDKSIQSKLALLQLAEELNVSKACELMGYSRDSYYRFKKLYATGGEMALKDIDRRKPIPKNRASSEVEKQVVEVALDYPNYGQEKVARLLQSRHVDISASGVRAIWKRHDLESKNKRLRALHALVEQENFPLSDEQKLSIERLHQMTQNQLELDVKFPSHLGVQDTVYIGNIQGVGDVYQHTFIDAYCKVALVRLYQDKSPIEAIDFLENYVLPWYQKHDLKLKQILTDKGGEFYGKPEQGGKYQAQLKKYHIDHITMRAYNGPEVNGICARFHTMQKSNFYDIVIRTQGFNCLDELQGVLQYWVEKYNEEIPHHERFCYGKPPMLTFKNSVHLAPKS
ncbi:helix-turn-helix domain-containing protein [Thalassotalea aquiviva]|uniref:helix-turn-helix domain-containing protein n=1 Tax=Thalassotalea aquiviva TaxID=3242415 RepID=UPI00352B5336